MKDKELEQLKALAKRWRDKVSNHYAHSKERLFITKCATELEREIAIIEQVAETKPVTATEGDK